VLYFCFYYSIGGSIDEFAASKYRYTLSVFKHIELGSGLTSLDFHWEGTIICDIVPVGRGTVVINQYIYIYHGCTRLDTQRRITTVTMILKGDKRKKNVVRHIRLTCSSHNIPHPLSQIKRCFRNECTHEGCIRVALFTFFWLFSYYNYTHEIFLPCNLL
jgi:hypothetical protein